MTDDPFRSPHRPPDQSHPISMTPWRTGRHVHRTIYDSNNQLIGVMDTPEDAAYVVRMVNGDDRLRDAVADAYQRIGALLIPLQSDDARLTQVLDIVASLGDVTP